MSIARKIGNLGTALDSAALSTFLSKGTTDGEFDTIAWGDVTGKPSYIDSSLATQLFDSAYVQLRQSAVSSGGLDSAAVVSLIDSNYVAARASAASSSGFVMYNYNATAGQTAFQDSDTAGNVLSYTANGILVYYNGLLLADEDYTATDGSAVTLTEGADSGAQITIGKWNLTGSGSSAGGAAAEPWGDRGLIQGGYGYTTGDGTRDIEYVDITTPGNASDFGDLSIENLYSGSTADGTYSLTYAGWDFSQLPSRGTQLDTIDYVTVATLGNATSFGTAAAAGRNRSAGVSSDGTTGIIFGNDNDKTSIEYITIATTGNGADFGDLTVARTNSASSSDNTYGLCAGGSDIPGNLQSSIDYVTIQTPANATNFGNLTVARANFGGCSDNTYSLFAGGSASSGTSNVIDYVTTATSSNATDYGDLAVAGYYRAPFNNSTTAVWAGRGTNGYGYEIDYVSISTPGNASNFGSLTEGVYGASGSSGSPS